MKRNRPIRFHFLIVALFCGVIATSATARTVKTIDDGWQFHLGDVPGAQAPAFDDGLWRTLDLPHDWAFEADYAPDAAQTDRGGYKPGGIGWYRKAFDCPPGPVDQRVRIEFDAAYMNSEVWINGKPLGKRPYGYISFGYDITDHLVAGNNTLAVRLDNSLESSARWYHGCGIYGHVRIVTASPVHVAPDGVYITTPEVNAANATVVVQTEIANTENRPVKIVLETTIYDPDKKKVGLFTKPVTLQPNATSTTTQDCGVPTPQRWDTLSPHRYHVVSRILIGKYKTVDQVLTPFGIRTTRWDKATGFWLNGRNVKLRGVCEHLEGGPVGAAYPDELIRWKIKLLKDMGCNAIRVAHNPQVPKFYDLCDEMGMLVMDEIFDGWKKKAAEDYGKQAFDAWWERDLRAWLKRDRNHPSVIIWSLGNETGGPVAPDLVQICHELDPTRLTTSGHSGSEFMDVEGVNGASEKMSFFNHAPDKPFISTEAPHTWQVRDFYRTLTWFRDGYPNKKQQPFPCPDLTGEEIFTYDWTAPENRANRKQIFNSSYDNAMVRITARKNWELMRDLPWHAGHFRWTGFDYLGEAGYVHGGWPFRAFMGGTLDLAGFEKDLYYFYQSQWTEKPMVHILPHWTHPKMKPGTKIPVWVYSNCDEVELFLNGKSLGKDRPGTKWNEMQCDWMVPWTPGRIKAIGYRNGEPVALADHTTAGAPAALKLSMEGKTCPIITVTQVDANGIRNPYAENRIHYYIDGGARILSLESGNPVNTENNTGTTSRTAFFGLARAFLQGTNAVTVGAILGDKKLMVSDKITIDVRTVEGPRITVPEDITIRYSTDGSEPATEYTGPFSVEPGTTVRAKVSLRGYQVLFRMSERFGPDESLYWADPSKKIANPDSGGDQAEKAKFKGARVSTVGKNYHGKGYLDFGRNQGAWVEWYQENDGGAGEFELAIRYSGKPAKGNGRPMMLTINGKEKKVFFPATGGYGTDWKTLTLPIKLKQGANTIRITTIQNGGMCIDDITVR